MLPDELFSLGALEDTDQGRELKVLTAKRDELRRKRKMAKALKKNKLARRKLNESESEIDEELVSQLSKVQSTIDQHESEFSSLDPRQ